MMDFRFDDSAVNWVRFGDTSPAFFYSILNIDKENRIADVLFKLPAKEQIVLHRHHALNHTFVVQGEHRIYEPDGTLRERRHTGSYTCSPASEVPHREGGGDIDTIVHFSIRPGNGELLYELFDENSEVLGLITFNTLIELEAAAALEAA